MSGCGAANDPFPVSIILNGLKIGLFHFGEIEHNFGSCMGGIKNNKTYPYQPTHELVNDEFPLRNFLIIRVQFLVLLAVYQRFTHLSHTQ